MKRRLLVFGILLLLVAAWTCTLFLVGLVPTMGKEWKKAKGEMPPLQTNLLTVSNWFEIDALLVSVFAVLGAATFAYALWLYSVGVAAGVVGVLFGWSFVPLVLGFPPVHRAQWTKAEGGPTLFQGFLLQATEWLQDGFHMIWTVFAVVFFTFVYVYALGMRYRKRSENALVEFEPSEVPKLGVDEDAPEPARPEAPQVWAEPEEVVKQDAPVESEAPIDEPEPTEVRETEDTPESDEPREPGEWDEPRKKMEGDTT